MSKKINKSLVERGQVIPLVVLMMFAIIAMVALILDGGSVISNRRTAQAAADAGALAGAQRACYGYNDAVAVATNYATQNGATSVTIPLATNSQVSVEATVENDSFFAKIFGVDSLSATAEATAGCYSMYGKGVMPLAFNCEVGTVGGNLPEPFDYECIMLGLDWKTELKPLMDGATVNFDGKDYHMDGTNIVDSDGLPLLSHIYIVMDTNKLCKPDGPLVCDLNGDNKNDLKFGGARSWLYVDPDISSLVQYLKNTPPVSNYNLRSHVWLTSDQGDMASGYSKMISNGWVGAIGTLPVYNYACSGNMSKTDERAYCMEQAHLDPWPDEPDHGDDFSKMVGNSPNYHIINFAPFYISCISTEGDCPGYKYAYSLNSSELKEKDPVIEGYFVLQYEDQIPEDTNMCDINLGNCIISLSD